MIRKFSLLLFVLSALLFTVLSGCKSTDKAMNNNPENNETKKQTDKKQCENAVKGTLVDKTGLDGCSMVIQIGDNEYLEPINLNELNIDIREGRQIEFTYEEVDVATICMVGKVVRITCVEGKRG